MRMYARDYVWGVQGRRGRPEPVFGVPEVLGGEWRLAASALSALLAPVDRRTGVR